MTPTLFSRLRPARGAVVLAGTLLAGACSVVSAQQPFRPVAPIDRGVHRIGPDAEFMQLALQEGGASLRAAALALDRSRDVRVREFALRAERDDSALIAGLARLRAQRGALAPVTQRQVDVPYRGLRGTAFDRRFVADRIVHDQQAVATFTREARMGRDPGLARFAADMLPMLRRHLAATQALQAQFDLRGRNFAPASAS
jgi:putative membrane protein